MGTSVERTSNVTDLETLGASYKMPSATVDGMSPEAVRDAIADAAERGRKVKALRCWIFRPIATRDTRW